MRFVPSTKAVIYMESGMTPTQACNKALQGMNELYPKSCAGIICLNKKGEYGGAKVGPCQFCYSVRNAIMNKVEVKCF